jgi:hypothetical protein
VVKPPSNDAEKVRSMLEYIGLGQYVAAFLDEVSRLLIDSIDSLFTAPFVDEGYDDMELWLRMDRREYDNMAQVGHTLYTLHTLLSYTPLLHSSRTLLSYTLLSYTPLIHSLTHSSHTLSHTLLSHTLHPTPLHSSPLLSTPLYSSPTLFSSPLLFYTSYDYSWRRS